MGLTLYEANSLWATMNLTRFLRGRTSWGELTKGVKPLDSASTTLWFTGAETSLWSNAGGKTKLTVGLPRCNRNWKMYFKRKQCCDGKKPNWNALPTRIIRDLGKLVCEVRCTDKCSFTSTFALILKPLVHIPSMVSVKYFCRRNVSPEAFLDHQNGRKDSQNNRSSWSFDDIIGDTKRYIHGSEPVSA